MLNYAFMLWPPITLEIMNYASIICQGLVQGEQVLTTYTDYINRSFRQLHRDQNDSRTLCYSV